MADVADLFFLQLEEEDTDEFYQSEINFEEEEETLNFPSPPIFSDNQISLSFDQFEDLPSFDNPWLGLGFDFDQEEHQRQQRDAVTDGFEGLRVVGFDSEYESESVSVSVTDSDLNVPGTTRNSTCWDLEEDFEWEEVDDRGADFLSMLVGERSENFEYDEEEESRNVDWEFLLAAGNAETNQNVEEEGDFINPSEYEILQFVDHDSAIRGTPPASKLVVECLPSVVLTEQDVAKNDAICAVCKDDIVVNEKVKQLPCMHHYHGGCILPWLEMRNTCPVCRFELPTDNPEYERWKAQRRERGGSSTDEDGGRYGFEMFSDAAL